MMPRSPSTRSMLILHQGAIGDFILALPSIELLCNTFPVARRAFLGHPEILELVRDRSRGDEVHSVDQKGMASFFYPSPVLDPSLSKFFSAFDLIVVYGRNEEGPLIGNLKRVCQGPVLHLNLFPSRGEGIHLTNHLLQELSRHGISGPAGPPDVHLNESERAHGKNFWKERGISLRERAGVTILHPGSGGRKKVWPLERFVELAGYLQKGFHSDLIIPIGPAESPDIERAFEERFSRGFFRAKGLSLIQLASVMEGCGRFIGNDSGVTHLAAALRIPTLAIFGPTDPKVWSPGGQRVVVVRKEVPCSPCPREQYLHCPLGACLKEVQVGDVLEGLQRLESGNNHMKKEEGYGREEGWRGHQILR